MQPSGLSPSSISARCATTVKIRASKTLRITSTGYTRLLCVPPVLYAACRMMRWKMRNAIRQARWGAIRERLRHCRYGKILPVWKTSSGTPFTNSSMTENTNGMRLVTPCGWFCGGFRLGIDRQLRRRPNGIVILKNTGRPSFPLGGLVPKKRRFGKPLNANRSGEGETVCWMYSLSIQRYHFFD